MLLLCLDSSSAASVALVATADETRWRPADDPSTDVPGSGRGRVLSSSSTEDTRTHAEVLAPAVREVLAEAGAGPEDLDAVLVGTGPGPFTGLRAGLVTARVLGFAWSLPVRGMTSLAALAHDVAALPQEQRPSAFAVAVDARRREVYWAVCRLPLGETPVLVDGPHVGPARELPELPVYGRGAGLYAEQLPLAVTRPVPGGPWEAPSQWQPSAQSLGMAAADLLAAGGELSADVEPLYLRESDAKVPGPRKRAGA
ncbi:tRNA (adenosine(37)-N6)-threonylcarbamoyltransferase complex dimerization subunit type 1 TsaB [Kocuria palustris]|uniref:tRNA (adenosine(37)-N6)-threonylcarbamoyltransferase complex dimerization subunit type 1 TsaB n=1 Tax=Kocuria palustris TaxID=71999 RepID=UPI00119EAC7F|nr:tRNA (adenosine(37)-N6)-threonylcarbamoyltransferase complex dimerization subunit type 1 TsaB [Kocuria palustris]